MATIEESKQLIRTWCDNAGIAINNIRTALLISDVNLLWNASDELKLAAKHIDELTEEVE